MKKIFILLVAVALASQCYGFCFTGSAGGKRVTVSVDGTWRGDYVPGTSYDIYDIVNVSGTNYKSLQNSNTGHTPASSPTYWQAILVKGDTVATGASVSDTAYDATSWNGETATAPSKNAVRDYLESKMPSGSDGTYGITYNNNTTRTPTAASYETYFDGGVYKVNQNGTEYSAVIGPAATQINFSGTLANGYACTFATGGAISCNTGLTALATTTPGTGVATALGNAVNGTGGVVTYGGNIGAATGTSLSLSGNLTGLVPSVVLTHASGVHDGSNNAAIMTDSGESFITSSMVGMTVYNITDGSSCTVTANDATTITCTLAGGTENDWDTNDVWQVGPGPNQSGSIFYVSAASTIRHPSTAGYAAGYYVDGAVVLTIDPASASMVITNATAAALDAGDSIDSPATAGSMIYLHNKSTTAAMSHGKIGTWTDGGAD